MHVYFAENGGKIKIGVARNVGSRLAQLRIGAGAPLNLIGAVIGGRDLERSLHKRLAPFQIDREWFRDCAETRAAIQLSLNNFSAATDPIEKTTKNKFGAVAKVLWPIKTDAHLATLAKVNIRTAARWISGEIDPPAYVLALMMLEIIR